MSKQPSRIDVRADYERRIAHAEQVIAAGPDLAGLRVAVTAAENALSAYVQQQMTRRGVIFPGMAPEMPNGQNQAAKQTLEDAASAARRALSTREQELIRAERDLALRPMLAAHADVKRIVAEMAALAADGDNAQRRLAAVDEMIAADHDTIEALQQRQQAALDDTAEATVSARLEGKPVPAGSFMPIAGELAEREASIAAARRQRDRLTEDIAAAAARSEQLRARWCAARRLAIELDLAQWLAENASFINTYAAIQQATGPHGREIELQHNEVEVARLAAEISTECPAWRPTRAPAPPVTVARPGPAASSLEARAA